MLVLLIKCVFAKRDLSVETIIVQHFAIQFRCHQHLIELSIFIFCRKNINLVNTVREFNLCQHTIDFFPVTVCRFDFTVDRRDYIFTKRMVDQIILFLKFIFILRLKVLSALIQNPVIRNIFVFYARQAIGWICLIELISRTGQKITYFLFLLHQLFRFFTFLTSVCLLRLYL